jgi:hypothetical protein
MEMALNPLAPDADMFEGVELLEALINQVVTVSSVPVAA